MAPPPFVAAILARLKTLREGKGIPAARLERALILGPGWIDAFESGRIVPSFDVLLAILHALGVGFDELTAGVAESSTTPSIAYRTQPRQSSIKLSEKCATAWLVQTQRR
jgi:transcriptional regulator with XRE-family HTH domain